MSQQRASSVEIGTWVKISGFEPGEVEEYRIVDDTAAKPADFQIGDSSPLAQALIGKTVGDEVPFHTPAGKVKLTIVDVGQT